MYRRALALHDEIYQALRSRGLYEKARELRLLIEQSSPKSQEDVRIGCQSTV